MSEPHPGGQPFVDLSDEQVHWDLSDSLSYGQYLNLDKLLDAQHPLSYQHDEMLFIVIHQVSELWMKLCLHELNATVACRPPPANQESVERGAAAREPIRRGFAAVEPPRPERAGASHRSGFHPTL